MEKVTVNVSENFKKMASQAIFSIVVFIIVYILLLGLAVGLTILCGYLGLGIIASRLSFITLLLGLGIASVGVFILFFLVKFIFKTHKIDRSHLIEITLNEEPKLFQFIQEIVDEVQTDFPKKIYLSSDVNASVFYDSSFWSMFFPIRKNLQIGVGLINTVSEDEFKAILAHEFGHFSQRSMKVGSYVYNVNQVIFNMLYDNDSYGSLAQSWASISGFIAIFVSLAFKIVEAIQWILRQVYGFVNKSYMSLSREMEFHADEVAANVAGSRPLITSLSRLELAGYSFNIVLNYYGGKINQAIKTKDIYPQHRFVMNYLAKEQDIKLEGNLPQVDVNYMSKYNKSKLIIKNQWASHPSNEDRVEALKKLNIVKNNNTITSASNLFTDIDSLQRKVTEHLFSSINYENPPTFKSNEEFIAEYKKENESFSFHKIFNEYFDHRNPVIIDLEKLENGTNLSKDLESFIGKKMLDKVYNSKALENDINILQEIVNGNYPIKSFDYDGEKFKSKKAVVLIPRLNSELEKMNLELDKNDLELLQYFFSKTKTQGKVDEFNSSYQSLISSDEAFENRKKIYAKMIEQTAFIQEVTPFDLIQSRLLLLRETEIKFRSEIRFILNNEIFQPDLKEEFQSSFEHFLDEDRVYFSNDAYLDDNLQILFKNMEVYLAIISRNYFRVKKEFLDLLAEIESQK
jgi:Zn-dependent protease with chaperone function